MFDMCSDAVLQSKKLFSNLKLANQLTFRSKSIYSVIILLIFRWHKSLCNNTVYSSSMRHGVTVMDLELLVFRVYYERPMMIDRLNLKLRQIARFSSNVVLDEMSSAKCRLLFGIFVDYSTRRKTTLPYTCGNFSLNGHHTRKMGLVKHN